jgi:hypothetical protein
VKQESTPRTVKIQGFDGTEYDLTAENVLELAKHGLQGLQTKPEPKPEPEPEPEPELTIEQLQKRIDKQNEEFSNYKLETQKEKQLNTFKSELQTAINSFDLLKEYPEIRDSVQIEAVAKVSNNPRLSMLNAVKQVVENRMEFMKKIATNSTHANTKVNAKLTQVMSGSGGMAELEPEKKFTKDDVNSGKSRDDVRDALTALMGELA